MNRTRLMGRAFGVLATVWMTGACGGGTPPPTSADDTALLEEPASGKPSGGGAAPASSPEVQEGIDAIEAGNFDQARAVLSRAVKSDPDDPQAAYYLGLAHENLGEADAAKEQYERALTLEPKLIEARVNLSALLLDGGEPLRALEVAEAGLRHAPEHPGLLLNRALSLSAGGKTAEAVSAFGEAVQASPDDDTVRYLYAEALAAAKKTDQSLAELDRLAKSSDPAVLASAARLFALLDAFDRCVATLSRAVERKPAAELFVHRGLCHHEVGDDAAAQADYEAALEKDPSFAPAHFYLGQHHKAAGHPKKAKKHFEQVVALAPDGKLGEAAKKILSKL